MKNKNGIALIMAVGILALLAVIATSFALNMRLEYKAAMNYYNSVKARYAAEAGMQEAIVRLREHVKSSAFDDVAEEWSKDAAAQDQWEIVQPGSKDIADSLSCEVTIVDEQRKININTAGSTLLGSLFDECNVEISYDSINKTGHLLPHRGYNSLLELKAELEEEFTAIRDYVTVHSYEDSNTSRSPININTADLPVLKSVLGNDALAQEIYDRTRGEGSYPTSDPFTNWDEFDNFIDSSIGNIIADDTEASSIKNNCNPNRLDDKSTTEFCFNSGGVYQIEATGRVQDPYDSSKSIAEKTVTAIVKIYDIYNETTASQFGEGLPNKVTWLDTCPVISEDLFGGYSIPSEAKKIPGSVKLGFWDDFNSESQGGQRDLLYPDEQWDTRSGSSSFTDVTGDSDDDEELVFQSSNTRCDLQGITGYVEWTWSEFALRVFLDEYDTTGSSQMKDAGWIMFRFGDSSNYDDTPLKFNADEHQTGVAHIKNGLLDWDGEGRYAYQSGYGYELPEGKVEFWNVSEAMANLGFPTEASAIANRYQYPPEVRFFTLYRNGSPPDFEFENYENDTFKRDLSYSSTKTFILSSGIGSTEMKNVTVDVWTGPSTHLGSYTRAFTEEESDSGKIILYGNNVKTAWDDIRIIPHWGEYTSQRIDTSIIPELSDGVKWATMAATITVPEESSWDPADEFDWYFRLGWVPPASPDSVLWQTQSQTGSINCDTQTMAPAESHSVIIPDNFNSGLNADGKLSIRYKLYLETNNLQRTPLLEDVTITYLPKVEILSWKVE